MKEFQSVVVRDRVSLHDFMHVMGVMQYFPLYEDVSETRLKKLFSQFVIKGYIFGCYTKDGECVGIVGIEKNHIKESQLLCLNNDELSVCITVAATCFEYRNKGVCTKLIQYAEQYFKFNGYQYLYLKNNLDNSMILNIARNNGFVEVFDVIETSKYKSFDGKDEERVWSFMRKKLV